MKSLHRRWVQTPSWQWNLLVLGIFAVIVVFYGSWQIKQNRQNFRLHALNQTQLIAGILERNAQQSATAQQLFQNIIGAFLASTADFILYLDSIESFNSDELAAFAWENNLALISLQRNDGSVARYPENSLMTMQEELLPGLHHLPEDHLYLLARQTPEQRLKLAVPAHQLEQLQQQLSQEQLLALFAQLPGIAFVETKSAAAPESIVSSPGQIEIQMREEVSPPIAEAQLWWGEDQVLVFGLEATLYEQRRKALFHELGGLILVLVVSGGLLSRLLYKQQQRMVLHAKNLERQLARQHEEAALGRAADSISHEIRNPLNAVSMGLQRIDMEANLDPEHIALIGAMSQALIRTNDTISQLQRFARPLKPHYQNIDISELLHQVIGLYRIQAEQQQVEIMQTLPAHLWLEGDSQLLGQALENLLKNALEAAPEGGSLTIEARSDDQHIILDFINPTTDIFSAVELLRLQEPYVSNKARGTGLGLPMIKKIVRAHQGELFLSQPQPGLFRARMTLPTRVVSADDTM